MANHDIATLSALQANNFSDASDITAAELREVMLAVITSYINDFEVAEQGIASDLNFNDNFMVDVSNEILTEFMIFGESTSDQAPGSENSVLQVEFGAAQNTGADPVMLSAAGTVTINEAGWFGLDFTLNTDNDDGFLLARMLVNGAQVGGSYLLQTKRSRQETRQLHLPLILYAATDTITVEIVRDSQGNNNGGLESFNPSTGGWNDVPSASMSIYRHLIANEV